MTQTNSIIYPATSRGVKNRNFSNGDCNSKQRTAKAPKNGVQARTARALGIMIFSKRVPRAHGIMTSKGYLDVLLPSVIQWRRSELGFGHLLVLFLTRGKLGLHYGTIIFRKGTIIIFYGKTCTSVFLPAVEQACDIDRIDSVLEHLHNLSLTF